MTCAACGYTYLPEYEIEWAKQREETLPQNLGQDEFITSEMRIPIEKYCRTEMHTIYICPKCGTMRIDL